ncbi:4-hydroxybenzoate polyprenyltransferase [Pseudomonas fluvialis]|uniref:4-hydroxybenzoate polyprenyltransferase n=1 Tax=Pseudomonas fluvialis TaxID=1793966 RepID=A0A7X0EVA9_9PSED|nr:UbiA family prenyltransferase [Pseudomonas fluvialis]MBB6342381.1 4-hydroxybenzoate polyprenyltransferase [Pseudomonas fluvialis]
MIATAGLRPQSVRQLLRLLSSIRFDEVLVLQGAPLMGVLLALGSLSVQDCIRAFVFAFGSLCLVGHVFVINDWAGIDGDLRDPHRAAQTFASRGVSRAAVGFLAVALLGMTLLLFSLLGPVSLTLAIAILVLSTLYSAPSIHMKGRPVLGSCLHLVGGTLHFLLGYATFSAVDERGIVIGCFFGLIFAAGHLMHEARGYDGDRLNGIRTNAVAFGRAQSFVAGIILFTGAYALLIALALSGLLPRMLVFVVGFLLLHLHASLRAWRAGLSFESLLKYQKIYRLLYGLIGTMLAGSVLLERVS